MPKTDAIAQFLDAIAASLADDSFVRLSLSSPVKSSEPVGRILGRLVELKDGAHLSLTLREKTRDTTKNIPKDQIIPWLREQLGHHYKGALLGTTKRDWQLVISPGKSKLIAHQPAKTKLPSRTHDQAHEGLLDDSAADWLMELGVLKASMADKYRQIDRYLEIFSHLARDCGWTEKSSAPTIVDMGCGKGYLTFAAWHLFRRKWQIPAKIIGVEARTELVNTTNQAAQKIRAEGLQFMTGTIDSVRLETIDVLIALHACNTATDDAILRGIVAKAKLIVVAPCCHQEIRPQLGSPEPLAEALKHGLMAERMAEWATDALRILFLEWAGYRTKAIEFVSSEHTPKNLMIAAVRTDEPFSSPALRKRIEEFKAFFGIQHHALDKLLPPS